MLAQLQSAARRGLQLSVAGIRSWPFWGALLLTASILYKLNWLDGQFAVGGMNQWKWFVNLGAMLVATFWTVFLPTRARAIALVVLDIALTALIFSDLVYFRYFKDFISVPVLLQAGQVGELGDSISSLIHPGDWRLFADIPIGIALAVAVWIVESRRRRADRYVRRKPRRYVLRTFTATVVLATGILMLAIPIDIQKNGWARGLFVGNWWNVPIYNVTGLLGFHGYDTYRYAKEHWFGGGVTDAELAEAKDWYEERRKLQKEMENEPLFGEFKGSNVLIVQAESIQEFVIGRSVGGKEITPNLNKLIGDSVYFPNFYHQTGQGRTSDADFVTSCSMHPLPTGSVFVRYAGNTFDCLPEMLQEQGYEATVHHAYDGSFWNRYNMYDGLGYDEFYSLKDYVNDEPLGWSIGDKTFFRQTVDQIMARNASPFYAFAISLTSHHPFNMPYSQQKLDIGEMRGTTLGNYVHAAHYVDAAIGELIEDLKAEGLWDNTIVMIYGDHDNSVYDWKQYEPLFGRELTELEKDTVLRKVPFIVHLPGDAQAGTTIDKAVGQQDTAPTLMHLLGISADDRYLMGVSALSQAAKPVVFRTGGFTDGRVYFVPSADGLVENGACYSLPDGERTDVSACAAGAEAARGALAISDRVVENDLIVDFRREDEQAQ